MSWKDSDTVRKLFVGNSAAKSVLRCLADHRNEQTGQCNPSADAIAWETELNKKTVYKAITYLEEKGFIRRERRVLNSSNNYVLNLSDPRNAENGTSTKNGSTKFGSTKNGSCTKNGISDDPKTGRVDDPNLGHESLNESVNESVNNYIESAPDFPLTDQEKTTISKTETAEKKKRQKKTKVPCPYNDDDAIPEEFLKVAQKHNIQNPQQLFSKMVMWCKANGKQYADYKAAFTTWCLNETRWKQKPQQTSNQGSFAYEPPDGFTEQYFLEGTKLDKNGDPVL